MSPAENEFLLACVFSALATAHQVNLDWDQIPAATKSGEGIELLSACIVAVNAEKKLPINWNKIANDLNTTSGAAQKRWSRFIAKMKGNQGPAEEGGEGPSTPPASPNGVKEKTLAKRGRGKAAVSKKEKPAGARAPRGKKRKIEQANTQEETPKEGGEENESKENKESEKEENEEEMGDADVIHPPVEDEA